MTTKTMPPQEQDQQPGLQHEMIPRPQVIGPNYRASGKLEGKVAIITGGDSGIGQSVAVHFAKEGADIAIVHLSEDKDAEECKGLVEKEGKKCHLIRGDVSEEAVCADAIEQTVDTFGHLDILVNNAAEQHEEPDIEELSADILDRTFHTNLFSYIFMAKAAVGYFKNGGIIINTTSVTAYRGSRHLLSYSATKGAIVTFTRSLSEALVERGIRVNGVAPGPVWTPLIPASFDAKKVGEFGKDVPMERPAQPFEIAPCYVFLASSDSSYMSGQVLHPNGGEIVNT